MPRDRARGALAHLVGWKVTLTELASRMRCSRCRTRAAEVVAAPFRSRSLSAPVTTAHRSRRPRRTDAVIPASVDSCRSKVQAQASSLWGRARWIPLSWASTRRRSPSTPLSLRQWRCYCSVSPGSQYWDIGVGLSRFASRSFRGLQYPHLVRDTGKADLLRHPVAQKRFVIYGRGQSARSGCPTFVRSQVGEAGG